MTLTDEQMEQLREEDGHMPVQGRFHGEECLICIALDELSQLRLENQKLREIEKAAQLMETRATELAAWSTNYDKPLQEQPAWHPFLDAWDKLRRALSNQEGNK